MKRAKVTPEQIEQVKELCSKGVPDSEIVKTVGVSKSLVGKIVANYWRNKMDRKKWN